MTNLCIRRLTRAIPACEDKRQEAPVRQSAQYIFYGKVDAYFFLTCDWHLLSGMTLRIALRQSLEDCVTFSENAAKSHKKNYSS